MYIHHTGKQNQTVLNLFYGSCTLNDAGKTLFVISIHLLTVKQIQMFFK